ncbi:tetratricopeptide repeat protein 22 [Protopterus annectens]|uniref:tetratricopeptide repeat protein 22 n=1 Tax=Protopterus annectens TaxID=7888 RepID=UPI001CFA48A6|nr:tetratricopeptide repeat protein 22 [Protopterus annectens]
MEETADVDIETLINEMDYLPGHFHLDLNLNCESTTPALLRRRDTKLKRDSLQFELEFETGSQQYAVRNLLGVFAFHLDDFEEAEEIFLNISKEAPGNLNAWANLAYVYDRLNKDQEGSHCAEKLSSLMGLGSLAVSERDARLQAAQCMVEHGYAFAFDVGLVSDDEKIEKLSTGIKLYNKAIAHGKQEIPIEEKRSWYFTVVTMYIRLDGLMLNNGVSEAERLSSFNQALVLLREVLKSTNSGYRALAWCYVGMMLERSDSFTTTPMAVHDCGFSATEPLDCYGKAIDAAKDDPLILNRLAKIFHFLGKQDMAIGVCNMALDNLPDPELNWQAYSTRAKINMKMYIRDLERAKMQLVGMPDRKHLTNAKEDMECILHACPCLKTYLDIGQVYYYMGVDAMEELLLVDESALNTALVHFATAMEYDLGDMLPEIHLLRGKCLRVKGEEPNAAECFKKSIELDDVGSSHTESFRCLIETLLALFNQRKADAETVIQEVELWVKKAEEKYNKDRVRQELKMVCRNHTADITELSKAMIKSGRVELVKLLFDMMQTDFSKKLAAGRTASLLPEVDFSRQKLTGRSSSM